MDANTKWNEGRVESAEGAKEGREDPFGCKIVCFFFILCIFPSRRSLFRFWISGERLCRGPTSGPPTHKIITPVPNEIHNVLSHPATGSCSTGFLEVLGSRGYVWLRSMSSQVEWFLALIKVTHPCFFGPYEGAPGATAGRTHMSDRADGLVSIISFIITVTRSFRQVFPMTFVCSDPPKM